MDKPVIAILSAGFGALLTFCVTATALTFPPERASKPAPVVGIWTVEDIFRGHAFVCQWIPKTTEGDADVLIQQPDD